jgi:hypothetical protein
MIILNVPQASEGWESLEYREEWIMVESVWILEN